MNTTILGIIGGVLSIIIGLWKFFTGKERKRQSALDRGYEKIKEGIKNESVSDITAGFDDINRVR